MSKDYSLNVYWSDDMVSPWGRYLHEDFARWEMEHLIKRKDIIRVELVEFEPRVIEVIDTRNECSPYYRPPVK